MNWEKYISEDMNLIPPLQQIMLHLGNHSNFSEPRLTHLQNGNNNIYSAKVEGPLGQAYKILDIKKSL